jgi:putative ABC transport system substrate-binding protein
MDTKKISWATFLVTFLSVMVVLVPVTKAADEKMTADKIPRVGFLAPQGRSLPLFGAFQQGLAELGYVEGRNVLIEPRFAEGQSERLPDLAAELVRLKVDVLVVTGAVTARAAQKASADIPIVFAVVVDPVADHVVVSLERPGGNLTGVTSFDPQQARKQLELLKEVIPGLKRVAILGDQGVSEALMKASEVQAEKVGLQTQRLRLAAPNPDLEGVFAAIKQAHADALLILEEPLLGVHAKRIAELAASDRLPTMFAPSRVDAGGLIAYGTSQVEAIHRMVAYVDKVLKGAKPSELPVDTVTRYELVVNLKTAQEIGVTIPPEVLKRADRVIK